jgi:hypothetical protein
LVNTTRYDWSSIFLMNNNPLICFPTTSMLAVNHEELIPFGESFCMQELSGDMVLNNL